MQGTRALARLIPFAGSFAPALAAFLLFPIAPLHAAPEDKCALLKTTSMPNTKITSAEFVAAGASNFQNPTPRAALETPLPPMTGLPSFCRVVAVLTPTNDSHIGIEVWMPMSGWNGKLESIATHLSGGNYHYGDMSAALKRNYAVAATDTGHKVEDTDWALGHPERMVDFAWRAVHEMTVAAKSIITTFYGTKPRYSYFNGCSTGGRQTLKEAQMFPDDYDGILSGSGFHYQTHLTFASAWKTQVLLKDGVNGASYLPPSKHQLVVNAAMNDCKSLKQVPTDNFLGNPTRCAWDPKTLICKAGQNPDSCITAAQAGALEQIYRPLRNPRTQEGIYPGATPITVPDWAEAAVRQAAQGQTAGAALRNFDSDVTLADESDANGPQVNAINPDLSKFRQRGGKLIEYHGWLDPNLAQFSVEYYESVIADVGKQGSGISDADALKQTQSFYRLFLAPGMGHCWGGPGPNAFGAGSPNLTPVPQDPQHDILSALEAWVERGVAPTQVVATKYVKDDPKQGIAMQRPLCPYPQEARYKGAGNTADAASFVCADASRNLKADAASLELSKNYSRYRSARY